MLKMETPPEAGGEIILLPEWDAEICAFSKACWGFGALSASADAPPNAGSHHHVRHARPAFLAPAIRSSLPSLAVPAGSLTGHARIAQLSIAAGQDG